jgi:carbon monoxide dehydrogenase subunit G
MTVPFTAATQWSRRVMLGVAIVSVGIAGACGLDDAGGETVRGSGTIETESRTAEDFSGVILQGSGNVVIDVDGTESLTITADDNILPLLTSTVSDGRLELGVRSNTRISPSETVTYRITAVDLDSVAVQGSGDVTANDIDTDDLDLSIPGSGDIAANGAAGTIEVTISGSGGVDASALLAEEGTVVINGSGDAIVNADTTLDVTINGSGDVEYLGKPKLNETVDGSGSISPG